jgi:hypothetical protein
MCSNSNNVVDTSEFNCLRAEILQRIKYRDNSIFMTIGILGGLLTFSSNSPYYSVILFYPIISFFISLVWSHNDYRIGEIGEYIKKEYENQKTGFGWQKSLSMENNKGGLISGHYRAAIFSTRGIFCCSQLVSIMYVTYRKYLINSLSSKYEIIGFIIFDLFIVIVTFVMIDKRKLIENKEKKN